MSRWFSLAVVGAMLISGCTGNEQGAEPVSDSGLPAAPPAEEPAATPDNGSIAGSILDDEDRPVRSVTVALVEANRETVSSEQGTFTFNDVAPGDYRLVFERLGFETMAIGATVTAQQITQLEIRLKPVAEDSDSEFFSVLTPQSNVLWMHMWDAVPREWWMNTNKVDEAHDTAVAGYNSLGFALGAGTSSWTLPIQPGLATNASLDPTGTIDVTLWVGAWGANDVGYVEVTTRLLNGPDVVFDAPAQTVLFNADLQLLEWSLSPQVAEIDAKRSLTWEIYATGPYAPTMGLGADSAGEAHSNIRLPVA